MKNEYPGYPIRKQGKAANMKKVKPDENCIYPYNLPVNDFLCNKTTGKYHVQRPRFLA